MSTPSNETLHQAKLRQKAELKALQQSNKGGIGAAAKLKLEEKAMKARHEQELTDIKARPEPTNETEALDGDAAADSTETATALSTTTTASKTTVPKIAEQIAAMSFYNPDKLQDNKPVQLSAKQQKKQRKVDAEKQRRAEVEAEVAGMKDERGDENVKLQKLLKPLGLEVHEIASDGNCMFAAVSNQLEALSATDAHSAQQLRNYAAKYIENHSTDFQPYLQDDNGNAVDAKQYTKELVDDSTGVKWGTHTELVALSAVLHRPIHVYTADSSQPIVVAHDSKDADNSTTPLRISHHKHYYGLGQHYNSLVKAQKSKAQQRTNNDSDSDG